MEKQIANLRLSELELNLTDEKIYLRTAVSQEAIALRSINGIGVVDLVDKYNNELTAYKNQKKQANVGVSIMVAGVLVLLLLLVQGLGIEALIIGGSFLLVGLIYYNKYKDIEEPSLKSAVRIMITGTQRDFEFDKAYSNANEVANFVAQVENTLSAFHKK